MPATGVETVVGVLALQGASEPHVHAVGELGLRARDVRSAAALDGLTHLIVPGGESTTLRHLLDLFQITAALRDAVRGGRLCVFGTCAGAILLGRDDGTPPRRLELMDVDVERNAYGRQIDSSIQSLQFDGTPLECVLIRAPRIVRTGPGVTVLVSGPHGPMLVKSGDCLAATFHPELTSDRRVHRLFLAMRPRASQAEPAP